MARDNECGEMREHIPMFIFRFNGDIVHADLVSSFSSHEHKPVVYTSDQCFVVIVFIYIVRIRRTHKYTHVLCATLSMPYPRFPYMPSILSLLVLRYTVYLFIYISLLHFLCRFACSCLFIPSQTTRKANNTRRKEKCQSCRFPFLYFPIFFCCRCFYRHFVSLYSVIDFICFAC